jgi:hypothetical protein
LFFLLNDVCLAKKQHIPILKCLVWLDRDSNSRSTALEAKQNNKKKHTNFIKYNKKRGRDREFESRSSQTKHFKIGMCCFSAKHTSLRRKSKYWLARNHENVSVWSDMSIDLVQNWPYQKAHKLYKI